MKRTFILIIILLLSGMTVFAQSPDMSFYTEEYNRSNATVYELLSVLQMVKDENLTGIGDFYQNAIGVFIQRLPNFSGNQDRVAVEEASRLLLRGLASEQHTDSASYVWLLIQYFDIASQQNDGYLMYEALVAMGQIDGKFYASHLAGLLESFNDRPTTDIMVKSKIQRVVPGIINALETLGEPIGVKPIFFSTIGWYDNDVKAIASSALGNLMDALGEIIPDIIIGILQDPFNTSTVKNAAWQEFTRINVSSASRARVAAAALEASYPPTSRESQAFLRTMRLSAINAIRLTEVSDDSVYAYLERTYREAYETSNTDMESIIYVVRALSAVKTDEAVDLLTEFLRGIHSRRRSGPWGNIEREIMNILVQAIAATGTQSRTTIQLLTLIQGSSIYTGAEQSWARNALSILSR